MTEAIIYFLLRLKQTLFYSPNIPSTLQLLKSHWPPDSAPLGRMQLLGSMPIDRGEDKSLWPSASSAGGLGQRPAPYLPGEARWKAPETTSASRSAPLICPGSPEARTPADVLSREAERQRAHVFTQLLESAGARRFGRLCSVRVSVCQRTSYSSGIPIYSQLFFLS